MFITCYPIARQKDWCFNYYFCLSVRLFVTLWSYLNEFTYRLELFGPSGSSLRPSTAVKNSNGNLSEGRNARGVWKTMRISTKLPFIMPPPPMVIGQKVKGQLVADVINSQHAGTGATWRINTKILSTCRSGRGHRPIVPASRTACFGIKWWEIGPYLLWITISHWQPIDLCRLQWPWQALRSYPLTNDQIRHGNVWRASMGSSTSPPKRGGTPAQRLQNFLGLQLRWA